MSELVLVGYMAAMLMGLIMGLIGGGGSILTVPLLVYFMAVPATLATAYSLLIVGATAAFGAIRYMKDGLIDFRDTLLFALPSILAVYLSRAFLMPAIPDVVFTEPFILFKDTLLMVVFALLMILSAVMMLTSVNSGDAQSPGNQTTHSAKLGAFQNPLLIMLEGAVVGIITGMLGAGGGFLIVPALVLLMGMPMKRAIGASLLIIAAKSLIGFLGDLQIGVALQVPLLPLMLLATFSGMMLSGTLAGRFNDATLKKGFSFFVLSVGGLILLKELLF